MPVLLVPFRLGRKSHRQPVPLTRIARPILFVLPIVALATGRRGGSAVHSSVGFVVAVTRSGTGKYVPSSDEVYLLAAGEQKKA